MFRGSSRFEINLFESTGVEVATASTYAIKNRVPSIVVSPNLFAFAVLDKSTKMAQYKIIVAIDFENLGKNYAIDKLRDLPQEVLGSDGFDVLITPNRTEMETMNELKGIKAFLQQSNPLAEIRWVIDERWNDEDKIKILECAQKVPVNYIRINPNLTGKVGEHEKTIELVKKHTPFKMKISGNVNFETYSELEGDQKIALFDVNLAQAKAIIAAAQEPKKEQETAVE